MGEAVGVFVTVWFSLVGTETVDTTVVDGACVGPLDGISAGLLVGMLVPTVVDGACVGPLDGISAGLLVGMLVPIVGIFDVIEG